MKTKILALCAIVAVSGCAACDPGPNPNPDAGLPPDAETQDACAKAGNPCSAHGTCNNDGTCECQDGWAGKTCSYDPVTGTLGAQKLCPGNAAATMNVTVDIPKTDGGGNAVAEKASYVFAISADAFGTCVWVRLLKAGAVGVPSDPGDPDSKLLDTAYGIRVQFMDARDPLAPDVPLKGTASLDLVENKATVASLVEAAGGTQARFERIQGQVVKSGDKFVAWRTPLSKAGRHYLANSPPVPKMKIEEMGNGVVEVDVGETSDEGSADGWLLSDTITLENGISPAWTKVEGTRRYRATLPGSATAYSVTYTATDRFGAKRSVTQPVVVDLCKGIACQPWQTCRAVDGACVGDNPCDPNPCRNGGACSPTGAGTQSCSCQGNWTGADCSVCPEGFTGDDCHADPCRQVTCSGHGTCDSADGSCSCRNRWGGTDCSVCPAGYAGADCDACAPTHQGYPSCVPDVTPPAAPALGLCESIEPYSQPCPGQDFIFDPGQPGFTVRGTCQSPDTVRMQVMDCPTKGCSGTWADFAFQAGSGTWAFAAAIAPNVEHWYYFRALDAAGNESGTVRQLLFFLN